jgi:hypothetical protein
MKKGLKTKTPIAPKLSLLKRRRLIKGDPTTLAESDISVMLSSLKGHGRTIEKLRD